MSKQQIVEFVEDLRSHQQDTSIYVGSPASATSIVALQERAAETLGVELPGDYLDLLSCADGIGVGTSMFVGTTEKVFKSEYRVADVVTHTLEVRCDYSPIFDGLVVLSNGSPLYGWDPACSRWFLAFYDCGVSRYFDTIFEMLNYARNQ